MKESSKLSRETYYLLLTIEFSFSFLSDLIVNGALPIDSSKSSDDSSEFSDNSFESSDDALLLTELNWKIKIIAKNYFFMIKLHKYNNVSKQL